MPRQRSIKSIFVEAIVFIGLLALVGHLSVNFWERFIIQSELTQMKTSLHSLKETLANIGTAYDNLHKELKGLVEITKKRHFPIRYGNIEPEHTCNALPKYTLDRRRLHDIQVKALLLAKGTENYKVAKANKTTEKHVRMDNKNLEAILKDVNQVKNATTITRYPPKSTGVGHQQHDQCSAKETCRYRNPVCDKHQCYKDYDQCQVQNQHYYNNWKC